MGLSAHAVSSETQDASKAAVAHEALGETRDRTQQGGAAVTASTHRATTQQQTGEVISARANDGVDEKAVSSQTANRALDAVGCGSASQHRETREKAEVSIASTVEETEGAVVKTTVSTTTVSLPASKKGYEKGLALDAERSLAGSKDGADLRAGRTTFVMGKGSATTAAAISRTQVREPR